MYLYGLYESVFDEGFFIRLEEVKRIEYEEKFEKKGGRLILKDGNVIIFETIETTGSAEIAIKKMKELVKNKRRNKHE